MLVQVLVPNADYDFFSERTFAVAFATEGTTRVLSLVTWPEDTVARADFEWPAPMLRLDLRFC